MNLILLFPKDHLDPDSVRLSDRRLVHIRDVQRAEVGTRLNVGCVNGSIGSGEISRLTTDYVDLRVSFDQPPPAALSVRLLLALPRPKMLRRVLFSAVSMGVKQIHLINSYRVEKSYWGSPLLEPDQLLETAVLGLEQARDTLLPEISLHPRFKPFVEDQLAQLLVGTTPLVAHPAGQAAFPMTPPGPVTLAIGPEGGFIPYEIAKLQECGFSAVQCGPRILRVETVVPALLARLTKV